MSLRDGVRRAAGASTSLGAIAVAALIALAVLALVQATRTPAISPTP